MLRQEQQRLQVGDGVVQPPAHPPQDDEPGASPVIRNETITLPKGAWLGEDAYLSLFAVGGNCRVTETGVEYPLTNHLLTGFYPLGVSNHILDTAKTKKSFVLCHIVAQSCEGFQGKL